MQSNWKFCKQCAHLLDETTVVRVRTPAYQQPQGIPPPMATVAATLQPQFVAAPPKDVVCETCSHRSRPGSTICESCGALVGSQLRKARAKKFAIVTSVVLGIIILLTSVAAAGWYVIGVKVHIQTDPAESRVVVDGQEVGKTNSYGALTLPRIRAGDHTLIVKRDGYDDWKQSFNIAFTDISKGLNVKLNATRFKLTIVSSPPSSEVLVDNISIGTTGDSDGRLETAPLPTGEHAVIVRHDGYREWKQTVTLSADQKLDVTLSSAPVVDENAPSAESEVNTALEGWAQSTRNRDVDAHMRYYADTLDYYYKLTQVPSSKVRDDRTKAFAKFNYVSVQLSNINVALDSTGQRATVLLDKTFDFRGDNDAFFSGSVQNQLTLTKLGGAWLITGEKELKVYYVNK